MRAVRYHRYGPPDVLQVDEVGEPVPAAGEVRLRVAAASLNPLDWKLREGHLRHLPGFRAPPRTTGTDVAGTVVALGGGTGARHVGERVFGSLSPFGREGSCAESCVIGAHRVVPIPEGVSFEQAAALPVAAGTAVQALADEARVVAGMRVLILGGAGGVGHFAVRYAKHLGAQVTATCSAGNLAFVAGLGADQALDYAVTDVTALGERFDIMFDAANALDWRRARALLVPGGLYLGTAGSTAAAVSTGVGRFLAPFSGVRARNLMLKCDAAAWRRLGELAAAGVLSAHIERQVTLDEVRDAQAGMQGGHGRGKIVVLPEAST